MVDRSDETAETPAFQHDPELDALLDAWTDDPELHLTLSRQRLRELRAYVEALEALEPRTTDTSGS